MKKLMMESFIEGYKQRAESSELIFDNASRMYAIALFEKFYLNNYVNTIESLEES